MRARQYLVQLRLRKTSSLAPLKPRIGCTAVEMVARGPMSAQAYTALGRHQSRALNTAATCEVVQSFYKIAVDLSAEQSAPLQLACLCRMTADLILTQITR